MKVSKEHKADERESEQVHAYVLKTRHDVLDTGLPRAFNTLLHSFELVHQSTISLVKPSPSTEVRPNLNDGATKQVRSVSVS